jgi:hypothetical protein
MEIGKPRRTYIVEPVANPVPQKRPEKVNEPAEPQKAPLEPEKVPVGA